MTVHRASLVLLAVWLTPSCRLQPSPDERALPREWLSLSAAVLDRRGSDATGVSDSVGFGIDGGWDFVLQPVRIGFELGALVSQHDLELPGSTLPDSELDVWRLSMGARLAWDLPSFHCVPYVRAGIFHRDEESIDPLASEHDGRGTYLGGGLDFWFDHRGRMGPSVLWYDSDEHDLRESLLGFSATFYY